MSVPGPRARATGPPSERAGAPDRFRTARVPPFLIRPERRSARSRPGGPCRPRPSAPERDGRYTRPLAGAPPRPRRPPRPDRSRIRVEHKTLERVAFIVAIGYLVAERAFAYVGIPKVNLYIGEAALVGALVVPQTRRALLAPIDWLMRPGRLHALSWVMTVFVAYGLFEVVRGVTSHYSVLYALKNFPFNYYVLMLVLGLWFASRRSSFVERLVHRLAWINAVYGVLGVLVLRRISPTIPGSPGVHVFNLGTASGMAILGLLCFPLRDRRTQYLLIGANGFVLLAQQVRAEWVGFGAGLVIWALCTHRMRTLLKGAAVVLLMLVVISLSPVRIPGTPGRGGTVSLTGIVGRSIAPIAPGLSARLVSQDRTQVYSSTVSWRTTWWSAIWHSSKHDADTAVLGHGYGYELRQLALYVPANTRTPHNVFFYALGYTGWIGVALFALLWGIVFKLLYDAFRATANPYGLCFAAVAFGLGLFGNWFETPYGAAPTYFVVGCCLAPALLVRARRGRRRGPSSPSAEDPPAAPPGVGPELAGSALAGSRVVSPLVGGRRLGEPLMPVGSVGLLSAPTVLEPPPPAPARHQAEAPRLPLPPLLPYRPRIPRVSVLGVEVSAITPTMAVREITRWIDTGERHYVCVTGVHGVMESQRDARLRRIHNESGLTTPDGVPLVWAGHWAGANEMERVYGPDLMLALCERAAARGWSVYFYGAAQGVPERLAARLIERFPGLRVAGTHSPPFRPLTAVEDAEEVEAINAAGPDLVFVGLSTPKQERWMAAHRAVVTAPVLIGVGAAFDFLSGGVRQAPRWMQNNGLEWLFRLAMEPRRLARRYLRNNPGFAVAIVRRRPRLVGDPVEDTRG